MTGGWVSAQSYGVHHIFPEKFRKEQGIRHSGGRADIFVFIETLINCLSYVNSVMIMAAVV